MQQIHSQAHWAVSQAWFHLSHRLVSWLVLGTMLALAGVFWLGYQYAEYRTHQDQQSRSAQASMVSLGDPEAALDALYNDQAKITELRQQAEGLLVNLSVQMGRVEAHLTRMNLLGEKLKDSLQLKSPLWDFQREPAATSLGNPQADPLLNTLIFYERQLQDRIDQLEALNFRAHHHRARQEVTLKGSGKPVDTGIVSSYFGKRRDPFHGKTAWHAGVDIAATEGAHIRALAGGMVKFAGKKGGYGQLVEIDHGNGLCTRYGHNQTVFVKKGQVIHKGDIIALLGSTGRSTGPHVHLEIHKDGQPVDPGSYFRDLKRS